LCKTDARCAAVEVFPNEVIWTSAFCIGKSAVSTCPHGDEMRTSANRPLMVVARPTTEFVATSFPTTTIVAFVFEENAGHMGAGWPGRWSIHTVPPGRGHGMSGYVNTGHDAGTSNAMPFDVTVHTWVGGYAPDTWTAVVDAITPRTTKAARQTTRRGTMRS
jgi:hypothetical protein